MTLEGFESVEDVIKREKKLTCKTCGQDLPWTDREDIKAIKVAMEAEKNAYQTYSKAAKKTKNPKGRDMFQQLSEFEMNHYQRLKDLLKSLQEKGEWILYEGTTLKKKSIPLKAEKPKGQEQLTDMDALKIAIREEKKAQAYYRSMAELTKDPRGRDMYKRLAMKRPFMRSCSMTSIIVFTTPVYGVGETRSNADFEFQIGDCQEFKIYDTH